MTQDQLFHEDLNDAFRHLIKALGGYETVGIELWPNKTRKAAGNWLSDCFNPERAAKPDLDDIEGLVRMGRDAGVNTAITYLLENNGFKAPELADPVSPKSHLLSEQALLYARVAKLQQDIDRLETREVLRAVKSIAKTGG